MNPVIRVLIVGPSNDLIVGNIQADYRVFNRLVGDGTQDGSISSCRLPDELQWAGFRAYCDDDAIERQQRPNAYAVHLGHYNLRGPVLIFRDDGMGNEVSLDKADVDFLLAYLHGKPTPEAERDALTEREFWAAHPTGMAFYALNDDLTRGEEIPPSG